VADLRHFRLGSVPEDGDRWIEHPPDQAAEAPGVDGVEAGAGWEHR
jgi:hypothetical protein